MSYLIKICHIFPDILDMYGDSGNVAALSKRLVWRGFECEISNLKLGENINFNDYDILILGGGSDSAESQALSALMPYRNDLKSFAENGGTVLALCGGYPMLGNYILNDGKKNNCLGVLDIYTENQKNRITGNLSGKANFSDDEFTVAGFENHFGKTYINSATPLIKTQNGSEGVIYKNVFATYLHGPLLPKNPKLCDEILKRALSKKYGYEITLSPLDDSLENIALNLAANLN